MKRRGDKVYFKAGKMIVENPEALKIWLTNILKPLCDADPGALAKYVLALIKKDKPEKELKISMNEQLDVFLQAETSKFVESLFKILSSKDYLNSSPIPDLNDGLPKEDKLKVTKDSEDMNHFSVDLEIASNDIHEPMQMQQPNEASVPSALPLKGDRSRRDVKDRERRNRSRGSRHSNSRSRERAGAKRSRSPRGRGRHRMRAKSFRRERDPRDVRRSRSPIRKGSTSPRARSRSPPRYRRAYMSRSRSRSRSHGKSRSPHSGKDKIAEKKDVINPLPTSEIDSEQNPNELVEKPSVHNVATQPEKGSYETYPGVTRCRDYEEKGLCMRGGQCPFDHGSDPVVLEDLLAPQGEGNDSGPQGFDPPIMSNPGNMYPNHGMLRPNVPPPSMGEYFPDSPSIDAGPVVWGQFRLRHPMMGNGRGRSVAVRPQHSQQLPPPAFGMVPPPARELISVPTVATGIMDNMMDIRGGQPFIGGRHPRGRGRGRGFDHGRLGSKPYRSYTNCSLEVKKIPKEKNTIMELNGHFEKFGKIVNIQICFENDPEAALITFSSPYEAQEAYRSTEAVFNNRFIRVFWHNKEKENEDTSESNLKPSIKDRLGGSDKVNENDVDKMGVTGNNMSKGIMDNSTLKKNVSSEKQQVLDQIRKDQEMAAMQGTFLKTKQEKKKEAFKLMSDLQVRKQNMLTEQLDQQKKLIAKLETSKHAMKAEERDKIMGLIKTLQESIEAIRKDIDTKIPSMPSNCSTYKMKEEAQKQVLDAELELYNTEQKGGDTVSIQKKISELRAKASKLGLHSGRGRGSLIYRKPLRRAMNIRASRAIDHRPTTIKISGFQVDMMEDVLNHFREFGDLEVIETKPDNGDSSATLKYSCRKSAEVAVGSNKIFKSCVLKMEWVLGPRSSQVEGGDSTDENKNGESSANDDGGSNENAPMDEDEIGAMLAREIVLTYDDDEEDEEDRSWRR